MNVTIATTYLVLQWIGTNVQCLHIQGDFHTIDFTGFEVYREGSSGCSKYDYLHKFSCCRKFLKIAPQVLMPRGNIS